MKESVKKIIIFILAIAIVIGGLCVITNIVFNDTNKITKLNQLNKEMLNDFEKNSYINVSERLPILVIIIIISAILLTISLIINSKKKHKNYRRETEGLVSPILAEAIVDGKIGLKELIMTTIIELNIRGNIRIIDNDMIELVSCDNLETYEQSIVDLLFKKKVIKFSDINKIFSDSNKKTLEFAQKISIIKNNLLEKLYSMNIFSKKLNLLNKFIGLCAILISINLPQILLNNKIVKITKVIFLIISIFVSFYYIKSNIGRKNIREEIINGKRTGTSMNLIIRMIALIIGIAIIYVFVAKHHTIFFIFTILTVGLNIYIAYQSQKNALTRKGKEEQAKLIELKNYINDYSLIKNREMESVIIWDEYLAYATAFEIPNKITDTIYEEWYNLNMNLQIVAKILN